MKFTRLRLSGFKSFVEPTEFVIEPGLTGVVGPNGCGKSNLLEALRWVMGESSYKSMRASGMDDVIFSGTATRPSRNMAEVVVALDNSGRTAPPAFNDSEIIEVSRRIEREAGSAYRINGRDARARDVQLLFADASTGSRSPALVRQGQIGEIINSKPQARRRILEEAAGITGLHTRRHEAELKLHAAETNLERIDDMVAQLEAQLNSLKRQARQASRYKQLSADIRRLEATTLYATWRELDAAVVHEAQDLDAITRRLAEETRAFRKRPACAIRRRKRFPPCARPRRCAPRCSSASASNARGWTRRKSKGANGWRSWKAGLRRSSRTCSARATSSTTPAACWHASMKRKERSPPPMRTRPVSAAPPRTPCRRRPSVSSSRRMPPTRPPPSCRRWLPATMRFRAP